MIGRLPLLLLTLTANVKTVTTSCAYSSPSPARFSTANATLVYAFVVARINYWFTLYAGLRAVRQSCGERIICTAARLIGDIRTMLRPTCEIFAVPP